MQGSTLRMLHRCAPALQQQLALEAAALLLEPSHELLLLQRRLAPGAES